MATLKTSNRTVISHPLMRPSNRIPDSIVCFIVYGGLQPVFYDIVKNTTVCFASVVIIQLLLRSLREFLQFISALHCWFENPGRPYFSLNTTFSSSETNHVLRFALANSDFP